MLCTSSKRKRKADQVGQESEPAPPLSKSALKKQEQLQVKVEMSEVYPPFLFLNRR